MRAKFTPGPYEIDRSEKYYKPCIRKNGIIVALLASNTGGLVMPENQAKVDAANAALLKAAPELYTALKELVRCVRGGDETSGVSMDDALLDADEALEAAVTPCPA